MRRIHFQDVNKLIGMVTSLDESLSRMPQEASLREEEIRNAAADLLSLEAMESLAQIPVEELRNSKSGIRVTALKDAGYLNLRDLALAEDGALRSISGIGEKQTASIRAILAVFGKQIAQKKTVRLSIDDTSEKNLRLIRAVAACRLGNELQADAAPVREEFHARAEEISRKPEYNEAFDICVSRAVANLEKLSGWCLPFVRKGGSFIAYKGENYEEELQQAAKVLKKNKAHLSYVESYKDMPEEISGHVLLIISK